MLKNKQNISDDEESRLDETDGGWSVEEDTGQDQQNDETNYDEYNDYEQDSEEIEDDEEDDYGGKRRDKKRHKGNKNDPNFIDNREIETELSTYHRDNRRAVAEIERSVFEEDNFDAERVAQVLNERYRRTAGRLSDDEEDLTKPEIATVDKLFAVKCRKGHVFHAIDRLENLKKLRSDPLKIKRVIAIDGIEDFVYIEADKEQDVQNAAMRCNKYLYSSKKNIKRLSPKEKQDLMAPKKPRLNIQIGSFVRTNKRDEYFGDLARVTSYSTDEIIEVEIIPRILVDQDGASLKRKLKYKIKDLIYSNMDLLLQDVEDFLKAKFDNESIMMELSNVASKITVYEIQDEIKVLQGSLKGSVGTVISVKDGVLTVTDKENGGRIFKVNSEECVKNINVHDYVQITNGPYQGQSGFVFNCDRHVMTMYLDHTNKQISVFAKDLKKGVQNSIVNEFGGFRYFDLVQLKDSSVGIIIDIRKAQKNYEYDVLNSENNLVKSVTTASITRSLHDAKSQTFKKGDQVVTNKMETYVFVRTYDDDTNLGFSCFKTKDLKLKYESTKSSKVNDQQITFPKQRFRDNHNNRGGGGRGGREGRGRGRGRSIYRHPLLNKRVQASQGALKGYQGTVKGVYGNMADVEFDAKLTTVKVELEQLFHVNEKGEALDPVIPRNRESSRGSMEISPGLSSYSEPSWTTGLSKQQKSWGYSLGSTMTSNTHLLDSANSGLNMDGSKTPALHSSGLLSGSKTPALRNSSANHSNNNHTSLGSKTPAWDLGSKTPAYGLMSDGSKTPAWDSGSHTPHSSGIVGGNSGNNSVSNISNIFGGSNSSSATANTNATINITSVAAETPGYSGITNTPGYSAVATPAADTPNYPVFTPANTGSLIPPTPRPFTPGNLPMTPANMIPQTPFATLSANHAVHHGRDPKKPPDVKDFGDWLTPGIEVRIVTTGIQSFENGRYDNRVGIVVSLKGPSTGFLRLDDSDGMTVTVDQSYLRPTEVQRRDDIKVIFGEHKGELGFLAAIDNLEGVVRSQGGDHSFINIYYLAKYRGKEIEDLMQAP
ncbi:6610_t:CDS:10 [Funneliformis mosseae]|uniref:Transcription elongation factor SPT5 n=1 Tax=Funneliformis mosseae TaxID=27381 RepID=A0A9N9CAY9_FUNMO|nr:6610_t:CDS:10 [Funneliformis mosseae]